MAETKKTEVVEEEKKTAETEATATAEKPKIDIVYRYVVSRLTVDGKVRYDVQAIANSLTDKDAKPAITNQQAVMDLIELGKQLDRELVAENIYANIKSERTADIVKELMASKEFAEFFAKIAGEEITKVLAEKFGGAK